MDFIGGFKHIDADPLDAQRYLALLVLCAYAYAHGLLDVGNALAIYLRQAQDYVVWNANGGVLIRDQLLNFLLGRVYFCL